MGRSLRYDQSLDVVCLADVDAVFVKKKYKPRHDLDRNVLRDASFVAAFSASGEFGGDFAIPGEFAAISDADTILGCEEDYQSGVEPIRNSAASNIAKTSSISEMISRDF